MRPFTQEFYDGLTRDEKLELVKLRLKYDDLFYAEKCLKIVDQREELIPLRVKQAQRRFVEVKWAQERARKPVRIIVLKARKEGISTQVQACSMQRTTQRANHKALVVAHDNDTSEEIFAIGETMYANLPEETIDGLPLKPSVVSGRTGQEIRFGQPSRAQRHAGDLGLNSSYKVDTANNYEGGRGFTIYTLHLSEFAFWQNQERKSKALFNAVPDTPETMIVIESTANGYNLFRKLWVAACRGDSAYYPLFIAWYEDPQYVLPFANPEEREEFIATIGKGEYGEHEPELVAIGVTPEQLHWRRKAIINKANGDLRAFWQEYPASWNEAFLATGRQVFSSMLVSRLIGETEDSDPTAEEGIIQPKKWEKGAYMGREIEVPTEPLWLPPEAARGTATPKWRRWEEPDPGLIAADPDQRRPPGQYVLFVDSASGVETASEGSDYFSIQIVNHRTLAQVAEWHARHIDADKVALQLYLAALLYSVEVRYPDGSKRTWRPWVGVETTGGYGLSIANKLWRVWKYPMLYFRSPAEQKGEKQEKRLGWSTDVKTKPLLVDHAAELLRLGETGIRSHALAAEMQTFVKDGTTGKMGAEEDYFDDRLDAWMGAQYIAREKPLRRLPEPGRSAGRPRVQAPVMHVRPPRPPRYSRP